MSVIRLAVVALLALAPAGFVARGAVAEQAGAPTSAHAVPLCSAGKRSFA